LSFYVTRISHAHAKRLIRKKSNIAEIKDDQIVLIKEKGVDALTLKNKLGTRYNEKRLVTKAKYQPGR
jgi:CRISPR/Cas system-associated endoribonuclease Cas2